MITFLAVIVMVFTIGLYWWFRRQRKRKKKRRELAKGWGKPKKRDHNWGQIRYYYDLFKDREDRVSIDDDTWNDLNFDEIFSLIDRTESNIGQQLLYDMLRNPAFNKDILTQREQWIHLFCERPDLRLNLQLELQKLSTRSVWKLSNLLFEELPDIPPWFYLLLAIPFLSITLIILGIFKPAFFLAFAALFVANIAIRYFGSLHVARYASALSSITPFLAVSKNIGKIDAEAENPLGRVGEKFRALYGNVKSLKSNIGTAVYQPDPTDLGSMFTEYLNIMFLLKLNMFTLSVRSIAKHQGALQKLYHHVGYIDALIAAASYKQEIEVLCKPDFTPSQNSLRYTNMVHPLLEEAVPNTVEVGRKGILVTGSNMSGKTTFLKTLGVNQIFAQTFNFCCAEQADITFCSVISSMRREDNITEGKSFYLGEVERVKKLVDAVSVGTNKTLFLLDEIFRGTNTIERISASCAVLKWLNTAATFVLASTHDLELVDMLGDEYTFNHFAEEVRDNLLVFDYKIKPGHSSTKNAIKLLGINNYPQEIVDGAMRVSEELEQYGVINYRQRQ